MNSDMPLSYAAVLVRGPNTNPPMELQTASSAPATPKGAYATTAPVEPHSGYSTTSTPECDFSKSQAKLSTMLDPKGTLSKLPPELCLDIYDYVLPSNYKQYFAAHNINGTIKLLYQANKSSPPIGLLYTSATIRNEAISSLTKSGICQIRIDESGVRANMPLRDSLSWGSTAIEIPRCKQLEIIVEIPTPRSAPGLMRLRRNVQAFVRILNNATRELPPIVAHLDSESHSTLQYTYNDYAMLIAPLGCIDVPVKSFAAVCSSPLTRGLVDPQCLKQCQLIESAATTPPDGDLTSELRLSLQQYLIDIRMELVFYRDEKPSARIAALFGLDDAPQAVLLGPWRAQRLLELLKKLTALFTKRGDKIAKIIDLSDRIPSSDGKTLGAMPTWLPDLIQCIEKDGANSVPPKELISNALDSANYLGTDYYCWAAGFLTRVNPFWRVW